MTVKKTSHAENLEQIDRYERICHALAYREMDPSLAMDVMKSTATFELIAAIDRLDKTLRETADSDGEGDRKARAIPRRHPSLVEKYLDRRKQRRVL